MRLPDRVSHGRIEPERDGARRDRNCPPPGRYHIAPAHPAGAHRLRRAAAVSAECVSRRHSVRRAGIEPEDTRTAAARTARRDDRRPPSGAPCRATPVAVAAGLHFHRPTPRRCRYRRNARCRRPLVSAEADRRHGAVRRPPAGPDADDQGTAADGQELAADADDEGRNGRRQESRAARLPAGGREVKGGRRYLLPPVRRRAVAEQLELPDGGRRSSGTRATRTRRTARATWSGTMLEPLGRARACSPSTRPTRFSGRRSRTDFFAMLRSWHGLRAHPIRRSWKKLDIILSTSTEPQFFIDRSARIALQRRRHPAARGFQAGAGRAAERAASAAAWRRRRRAALSPGRRSPVPDTQSALHGWRAARRRARSSELFAHATRRRRAVRRSPARTTCCGSSGSPS